MKCRNNQSLTLYLRQKKYDSFVCYCYEGGDSDFAENTIKIHLEENRELKLCIHRRDLIWVKQPKKGLNPDDATSRNNENNK